MKLSPNYTLDDLTLKPTFPHKLRSQRGLTEQQIIDNLTLVALNILEPLRAKYGKAFVITSCFRADGKGNSQHYNGEAVDIQFAGLTKAEAPARASEMSKLVLKYDQFIIEHHGKYGPVFHISISGKVCRKQCLTTPDLQKYVSGFFDPTLTKQVV